MTIEACVCVYMFLVFKYIWRTCNFMFTNHLMMLFDPELAY